MTSNPMPDQVQKNQNYQNNPFDPNPNPNPNPNRQKSESESELLLRPADSSSLSESFFSTRVMNKPNRVAQSQFGMNKKQHKLPGISIYSSSN